MRSAILLLAMLLIARTASAQLANVGGVLVSRGNRLPVEGVRVAILGTALSVSTDSGGRFELAGIPPGIRVLQARAIGFAVASWLIDLVDGQTFRDTFDIEPRLLALTPINVLGDPTDWRSEAAFERRRMRGEGYFFTREDISQRAPNSISDLLRTVPGVLTVCTSRGCIVRMARTTNQCLPEFYLDGFVATRATGADFPINVASIRGIEVYRTVSEVPPEFQKIGLRCGVIAIWTIEPGERFDNR